MNRILMAAARGARIEDDAVGVWSPAEMIWLGGCAYSFRVHRDDTHLMYGPISSALRKHAERPPLITGHLDDVERCYIHRYKGLDEYYARADDFNKSIFLLLVAECISEEGL